MIILVLAPFVSVDFNFSKGKIDPYSTDFEAKKLERFQEEKEKLETENKELKKRLKNN